MNLAKVKHLIEATVSSEGPVIYLMDLAARSEYNDALNFAVDLANERNTALYVFYDVKNRNPKLSNRQLYFLLEGITELQDSFQKKGIFFQLLLPTDDFFETLKDASALITESGFLNDQRMARRELYFELLHDYPAIDYYVVDTETLIPIDLVSDKKEYGAYTLRPKIHKLLHQFLDVEKNIPINSKNNENTIKYTLEDLYNLLKKDNQEFFASNYHGGEKEAKTRLSEFIQYGLDHYDEHNDPSLPFTSNLSLYLTYGQISVYEIYESVKKTNASKENIDAFLEQLIVRRELAFNYCYYEPRYESLEGAMEPWARRTMLAHQKDERAYDYSIDDYLTFQTHDPYFNTAMKEMVYSGYMHNYIRMYWAKKIIEWSSSYLVAYTIIEKLNNTYFIDGLSPLSYTGIGWSFGLHDKPFQEREIFGNLRYMNDSGLKRKFNIEDYVSKWSTLEQTILSNDKNRL